MYKIVIVYIFLASFRALSVSGTKIENALKKGLSVEYLGEPEYNLPDQNVLNLLEKITDWRLRNDEKLREEAKRELDDITHKYNVKILCSFSLEDDSNLNVMYYSTPFGSSKDLQPLCPGYTFTLIEEAQYFRYFGKTVLEDLEAGAEQRFGSFRSRFLEDSGPTPLDGVFVEDFTIVYKGFYGTGPIRPPVGPVGARHDGKPYGIFLIFANV